MIKWPLVCSKCGYKADKNTSVAFKLIIYIGGYYTETHMDCPKCKMWRRIVE